MLVVASRQAARKRSRNWSMSARARLLSNFPSVKSSSRSRCAIAVCSAKLLGFEGKGTFVCTPSCGFICILQHKLQTAQLPSAISQLAAGWEVQYCRNGAVSACWRLFMESGSCSEGFDGRALHICLQIWMITIPCCTYDIFAAIITWPGAMQEIN